MPSDLIQPATSLGVAGFAVLIMWWAYQSSVEERKRYDDRLDQRDAQYRALEKEVRVEVSAQLAAATSTIGQNQQVMERVLDKLNK